MSCLCRMSIRDYLKAMYDLPDPKGSLNFTHSSFASHHSRVERAINKKDVRPMCF